MVTFKYKNIIWRSFQNATTGSSQIQELAIGNHLADYYKCRAKYTDNCFSILCKAQSKQYLAVLEAITICAGKEGNFIYFACLVNCMGIVVGDSPMTRIMDLPKGYINQELSW